MLTIPANLVVPSESLFNVGGYFDVTASYRLFGPHGRVERAGNQAQLPLQGRGRQYSAQPRDLLVLDWEGGALQVLWHVNYNVYASGLQGNGDAMVVQSWSVARQVREGALQELTSVNRPVMPPIYSHQNFDVRLELTNENRRVDARHAEAHGWLSVTAGHAESSSNSLSIAVAGGVSAGRSTTVSTTQQGGFVCHVRIPYRSV